MIDPLPNGTNIKWYSKELLVTISFKNKVILVLLVSVILVIFCEHRIREFVCEITGEIR